MGFRPPAFKAMVLRPVQLLPPFRAGVALLVFKHFVHQELLLSIC